MNAKRKKPSLREQLRAANAANEVYRLEVARLGAVGAQRLADLQDAKATITKLEKSLRCACSIAYELGRANAKNE